MVEPGAPLALPATLQGRYRIGPEVGRGGASVVYRARDLLIGRDVAIKVFSTRAKTAEDVRAQEGEARMLGGLNHPALVSLLDAGVDLTDASAPQMYLIMEFADGPDLRRRLRTGTLTAFEVAYLAWDLLGALQYVHDRGIIHRDLKPANVLLVPAEARPARGKLADFGIAVLTAAADEPSEETTGTAAYLSPEQVEGRPLGSKTDIYSLGLVLLEAYTGRPAFPGGILESAFARLEQDPGIPPTMPAAIAAILRRMTARSPDDRPSAREAVTDFREVIVRELGGERPTAPDPEAARLAAVRDSHLLDSPPDAEFDRITAIAARVFDVPIAVVTVVGADRVWLKSRHGMDVAEIERSQGLGATGALHDQTLVIEDVTTDPRIGSVPGADASRFRFYAGVPLITADGHNLGSFAIADLRPRSMGAPEVATLEDLAAIVLHEMELRNAVRRVALGRGGRLD